MRTKLRGKRERSFLRGRLIAVLPGQYYDAETGLYQNWNRDYDPSIGRYLQSDPIGLDGGLSTYGYADANPLAYIDFSGQDAGALAAPRPLVPPLRIPGFPAWALRPIGMCAAALIYSPDIDGAACEMPGSPEYRACPLLNENAKGKKVPKPGVSGKEGAKDVPSWAKGERPDVGESGKDFADRLLGDKYGPGNYDKGPGSEWSKVRKWGDRSFTDPK